MQARNTYNKKELSHRAKLRQQDTVIKCERLCAAKTLDMFWRDVLEDTKKGGKKLLIKILGSKMKDREIRFRLNQELYQQTEEWLNQCRRNIAVIRTFTKNEQRQIDEKIFDFFRLRKTGFGK